MFLYPKYRKGILIIIIRLLRGRGVILLKIIEIPVMPPSRIVFGIKKFSKAKLAMRAPRVIIISDKIFFKFLFLILDIFSLLSF